MEKKLFKGNIPAASAICFMIIFAACLAAGCGKEKISAVDQRQEESAAPTSGPDFAIPSRESSGPDSAIPSRESSAVLEEPSAPPSAESAPPEHITGDGYSFDLPGWWKGKYRIENTADEYGQNYLHVYQESSYRKMGGGDLFTVSVFEDASYINWPDFSVLAYDGGKTYVKMEPTDVSFAYEDEAIREEYAKMSRDFPEIVKSFKVDSGTAKYDGNEYIFPVSNAIYLKREDIINLSKEDLRRAKNEIYARHGYLFSSADLKQYFGEKSWYHASVSAGQFDSSVFNAYEEANVNLLGDYEKKKTE